MPKIMQDLIKQYVEAVMKIYGSHVRQIILYGSYARGDFRPDSDVDIMDPDGYIRSGIKGICTTALVHDL